MNIIYDDLDNTFSDYVGDQAPSAARVDRSRSGRQLDWLENGIMARRKGEEDIASNAGFRSSINLFGHPDQLGVMIHL